MTRLLQHYVSAASEEREREIAELGPWFHNLHLPDGTQTAPGHALGDFPAFKWNEIAPHLPADLTGWTALDIGCNAGFYTFQLAARGAHVTGIDVEPLFLRQAEWAAGEFGVRDRVKFEQRQVYADARDAGEVLAPATDQGQMDQVVFNSTLNGVLQALFAVLVLVVVANAVVVIARAIRLGRLPTTEEPPTPSRLVEPAGFFPTTEEKEALAEHRRLVGAGAGRTEAEEK